MRIKMIVIITEMSRNGDGLAERNINMIDRGNEKARSDGWTAILRCVLCLLREVETVEF